MERRDIERGEPEPPAAKRALREENESLFWLTVAPMTWMVHLLGSYLTVSIVCGKLVARDAPIDGARLLIGAYTIVALAVIGVVGWRGLHRHRRGPTSRPHHADTAHDRHGFLGFATLLLSLLSAVGVIYVALAAVFFGSCR